jgi:hypothetical protein
MNRHVDLGRQIAEFFASEAPPRAPDRVLAAVLETTNSTRQRRAPIRLPWRFPMMNTYAKVAIAAMVVIAVGAVGLSMLGPRSPSGVGGESNASPTPSPSPPLTETFTSAQHGFSISYPSGWVARPATDPWTTGVPEFASTAGDVIYDPVQDEGHLWIMVASQPLAGKTGNQWVDDILTGLGAAELCEPPRERVTIDGAPGETCASSTAAVTAGDRGYLILLYVSRDDPAVGLVYDQQYFEHILATVQLLPEDAKDVAASASP